MHLLTRSFPIKILLALAVSTTSCGSDGQKSEVSFDKEELDSNKDNNNINRNLTSEDNCDLPPISEVSERVFALPVTHRIGPSGKQLRKQVLDLYRRQMQLLPFFTLDLIEQKQVRYLFVDGPVSDFGAPFDGRVSPYGGSSQLTWGNLPGGEHYGNVYLGDETRFQSGAMSLLLHETAHAVDRTLTPCGTDGDCPYNNLRRIFDHESINFRKSKKESDLITAYRMSSKEEFFAVGFDEYYCSGSSRKSLLSRYPSLFSLFRNLDK